MSEKLYDLSILSEMVNGDVEFMQELINTFIDIAPIDAQELQEYSDAENWEETSKKAHKLKSSIRTLGVVSLMDLILKIEVDARNQVAKDIIQGDISLFVQTLNKVLSNLQEEELS